MDRYVFHEWLRASTPKKAHFLLDATEKIGAWRLPFWQSRKFFCFILDAEHPRLYNSSIMLQPPNLKKPFFQLNTDAADKARLFKCIICSDDITGIESFRDELSRKEYTISGMCQKCQDGIFEADESEALEDMVDNC